MKRQFGFLQLIALPVLACGTMVVGVYLNTQLTYMLQSKHMFGIPPATIGATASALTIWSLPFSLAATFLTSYAFEILGRRWTLFLSYGSTAVVFAALPYAAPHYGLLVAARCAIGVTMAAPIAHPLIADFVHKKSRGKAIALQGLGLVAGEVTAMGVLFNATKSMGFRDAFATAAVCIGCWSIFTFMAIRDPDLTRLRRGIDSKVVQDE